MKAGFSDAFYQNQSDNQAKTAENVGYTAYIHLAGALRDAAAQTPEYPESNYYNGFSDMTYFSSEPFERIKTQRDQTEVFPVSQLLINLIEGNLSVENGPEMLLKMEEFYMLRNYAKEKYFQLKKHFMFLKQNYADKRVLTGMENQLAAIINDYHSIGRKNMRILFKTDIYIPVDDDLISGIQVLQNRNASLNNRELEIKQAGALFHQHFGSETEQVLKSGALYGQRSGKDEHSGVSADKDLLQSNSLAKAIYDFAETPSKQSATEYIGAPDAGASNYSNSPAENTEVTVERQAEDTSARNSSVAQSLMAFETRGRALKDAEKTQNRVTTKLKGHERSDSTEDTSESGSEPNAALSKMYYPVVTEIMKPYDISNSNGRTAWMMLKNSGPTLKGELAANGVQKTAMQRESSENETTDTSVSDYPENTEQASQQCLWADREVSMSNSRPGDGAQPAAKGLSAQMLLSGSEDSAASGIIMETGSAGSSKSVFQYISRDSPADSTPTTATDTQSTRMRENAVLDYADLPNTKLLVFREQSVTDQLALPMPFKRQLTEQQIYRMINMAPRQQNLGQQQMLHFYAMVNRNYSVSQLMEEFPQLTRGGVVHLLRTVLSSYSNSYSYIMIRAKEVFEERKSYISDMAYQIKLAYQKVVRELYLLSY